MTEHLKIENKDDILTLTFARARQEERADQRDVWRARRTHWFAAETDPAARASSCFAGEGDMFHGRQTMSGVG